MGGAILCLSERRGAYRVLVGKTEEERPLGRSNLRRKNDLKIYLQKVIWERNIDWIGVV
jgi:hypothetical protein